jgi:hypothetical protein
MLHTLAELNSYASGGWKHNVTPCCIKANPEQKHFHGIAIGLI